MKFTNYTAGPKGVHTKNGLVYVDAGKSAELDVSEAEAAAARATGWFSRAKVEDDDDADEGLNGSTVAELKDIAEKEQIDLGDATKKANIIAAIELAREAKAGA